MVKLRFLLVFGFIVLLVGISDANTMESCISIRCNFAIWTIGLGLEYTGLSLTSLGIFTLVYSRLQNKGTARIPKYIGYCMEIMKHLRNEAYEKEGGQTGATIGALAASATATGLQSPSSSLSWLQLEVQLGRGLKEN
jgi:hypothetical protein